ncbi:MAG: zinc ribbon domain-containing protein [Bacillota bacterium]|nr:zinc ribbon domain-containing protein [Bacillota bacterium]
MLEILGVVLLSNVNKKNALARGQKPGLYVALTFILWLLPEFCVGFFGGMLELGPVAYLYALMAAATGGLISYLIAKYGKQGSYVPPAQTALQNVAAHAEPLESPAEVTLTRVSSMVSSLVSWSFTLNGYAVGQLKNGQSLKFTTRQRQNVLIAKDAYGSELPPFVFEVEAGAEATLFFKVNRFLPEKSTGLRLSSPDAAPRSAAPASAVAAAPAAVAAPGPPALPDAGPPRQAAFCHKCGTALSGDVRFCENCGQPRFVLPPAAMPEPEPVREAQSPETPPDSLPGIEKPQQMFAVWLSIGLTAAWVLNVFFHIVSSARLRYDSSFANLASAAILACSAWLWLQKPGRSKAFGAGLGVLAVLLNYLTFPMHIINRQRGMLVNLVIAGGERTGLADIARIPITPATHFALWRFALLSVGSVILFYHLLRRREPARRLQLTALFSALTIFLVETLLSVIVTPYYLQALQLFASFLVGLLTRAAAFGLVLSALESRATMRNRRISLSGWGLVWTWLATLGAFSSIVILLRTVSTKVQMPVFSGQIVMAMAWLLGYILLLCGRRLGWYVIFITAVVGYGAQFALSTEIMIMYSPRLAYRAGFVTHFVTALVGPLNPLITWLSIRRAWRAADDPSGTHISPGRSPRPYGAFDRFASIFNLIAGLLILLILLISALSLERVEQGMLPPLIISLLAIAQASVSLVVMRRKYPTVLRVLNIIFFVFMVLLMSAVVISALMYLSSLRR